MNQLLEQAQLWCNTGGSDKLYYVWVEKSPTGQVAVESSWGARGRNLSSQNKFKGTSVASAMQSFHSLVQEKQKKGYKQYPWQYNPETGRDDNSGRNLPWYGKATIEGTTEDYDEADVDYDDGPEEDPTLLAAAKLLREQQEAEAKLLKAQRDKEEADRKIEAARLAQIAEELAIRKRTEDARKKAGIVLPTPANEGQIESLIADATRWAIPCTGDLVVVNVDMGRVVVMNSDGVETLLSPALTRSMMTAPEGRVEGFIQGNELTLTDIFTFHESKTDGQTYEERLSTLEDWYEMIEDSSGIAIVEPATDADAKNSLVNTYPSVEFRKADAVNPDKILCA